MVIKAFPPVETADEDGLLALGGDLDVESLILAYESGIFPWPIPDLPLTWFSPPKRAILEFDRVHLPRSLKRAMRNQLPNLSQTVNCAFEKVIKSCSEAKDRKGETWITQEMKTAYTRLHKKGYAHSFEIWDGDDLVGALYGVHIGGYFSAESMFFKKANASKFALLFAIETLEKSGLDWMDIQMMSPHMEHLGASEIPRSEFLKRIRRSRKSNFKLAF